MNLRRLYSIFVWLPVFFLLYFPAIAQRTPEQLEAQRGKILRDPKVSAVQFSGKRQTPSMIVFNRQLPSYPKDKAIPLLADYLSVRPGVDQLQMSKQSSLPGNFEVFEFQQFFHGIKAEHGRFKALMKDGNILFFNGAWYDIPAAFSVEPAFSEENALQKAKEKVNARKYATDFFEDEVSKANNAEVKQLLMKELGDVSPKGELVIVEDFTQKDKTEMRLAYKFDIYAIEPMSRAWIYVDAKDGRILLSDPIIKHINTDPPTSVSATVQTRYAGARNIYVKRIGGNDPQNGLVLQSSHPTTELYIPGLQTWVLADDTKGKGIETYDLNGVGGVPFSLGAFYAQGKSFTDVDNNWTLFEHKRSDPLGTGLGENGVFEAENDDIAWDAHWGAEVVYDYWLQKHNRRSFDDRDAKIKSFIHFGPAYDNAFWNGSAMTYGDGSGPGAGGFRPLTSLDVCAHEIGHGVCTYTSNLVYAHESGAMNEAFSDIWAASIEHFAIASIDASLTNRYRPFYIGEQIAATPDEPLRRMDNPKAVTDPDTYGGQFWRNPDCSPDILNDNCGVHTNSGVLNKWFYLLTAGSHTGSGPDAVYARADSDDGINDLGNNYNVTGLGFNISEQITYLTEIMLTATATYSEARDVSIGVATVLSGDDCSNVVHSVTDAWYAVGVGPQFSSGCISTYGFIYQPGATVSEGNAPAGCAGEYEIKVPVLLPAKSTATITTGGNAISSTDYRLSSTALSNTTASTLLTELVVYIKSDAVTEPDETISLGITVTNTGANPVNGNYVITIADDDIEPVIGSGTISLLSGGNFDAEPDGYNSPAGWTKIVEVPGENRWGVWGGQLKITGVVEGVQLQPGHYNDLSETSTTIVAPQIDARGLSNIRLKFDFRVQGEVDINGTNPETWGVFDYMMVMYSFDGINFSEMRLLDEQFRPFSSLTPAEGTFEAVLPSVFNNTVFYIAFKWYNDTNAGGPESVSLDNITIGGTPRLIENDLNDNSRENLKPGHDVYFYSIRDGQVLGKVKNNSAKDFGCTNMYVEKTGTGAFNLYQSRNALHKVADKIVRIEPSFIYKVSTTVKLFFTEQQLQALESATNQPRSAFRIYRISAASYAQAANNNTAALVPVYAAIPGVGGTFTVSFNEKPIGSYALGYPVSVLGIFSAKGMGEIKEEATGWKFGNLYPNPSESNVLLRVYAPLQQKISIEVVDAAGQMISRQNQYLSEGHNSINIQVQKFVAGKYVVRLMDEKGNLLHSCSLIKH